MHLSNQSVPLQQIPDELTMTMENSVVGILWKLREPTYIALSGLITVERQSMTFKGTALRWPGKRRLLKDIALVTTNDITREVLLK